MKKMKKKIEGSGGGGSRGENQSVNTVEGEKKNVMDPFLHQFGWPMVPR